MSRPVTMPRILFVNRFYYPDHSATAQILTDLAEDLARRGWSVIVVTSRLRYDDVAASLPAAACHAGVQIRRIWSSHFGRAALVGRAVDYASFYVMVFASLLDLLRRGDIVVAKTDPPLVSIVVAGAVRLRGARLINWFQDLYPEVAAALGVRVFDGAIGSALRRLRNHSAAHAAVNVAIGERMVERLIGEGLPPARLRLLPNWSDDVAIRPFDAAGQELRSTWGLAGRFVVGYSGNLGRAHEVETLLGAAKRLPPSSSITFLMIGGGHAGHALAARVAALGLADRFQFRPYQPRAALAGSLGVADVHWLSLRPELEGLIVPSKFYGIAAAGRPVIAITDPDGEIARLVSAHDCGVVVAPGDTAALCRVLIALAADPERVASMGRAARDLLDARFTRAATLAGWDKLLREVAAGDRFDVEQSMPV